MSLPFKPEREAVAPSSVKNFPNGKIPSNMLEPCGIRSFVMAGPAARAMRALVKAANRDGIRISATGTYRSYDRQVALFRERFTTTNTGRSSKVWNGVRYYLKPGVAMAATPGTSNHGRGVAVDFAELNGANQVVSLSRKTLDWLAKNGPRFGYFNTVQSEAWHWCWCLGDEVPVAVLAEEGAGTVPLPQAEPVPVPPPPPAPDGTDNEPGNTDGEVALGTYTVQRGDSWWSISSKVLGKGSRWREIAELNGSPRTLFPGQVLQIPGMTNRYTVAPGDSYWAIAQKALGKGSRWREVSRLNNNVALKPGMTILLPEK